VNPNAVYRSGRAQIDHHPMQMGFSRLAREMRIEIRIAFPKRFFVAIGDA